MNQKQQNPGGQNRGFTVRESLNFLGNNLPQPAPSVNGECAACAYFHESTQGRKNRRRVHSVCSFSGEPISPYQKSCPHFATGGVDKC